MIMLGRWRRRRAERIAESDRATAKTQRLARAISPMLEEAQAVTSWAEQRIERNHLAELFVEGRR